MALLDLEKNIVLEDDRELEVLGNEGVFIAYFRPGRSVYVSSSVGSEYNPAKIVFGTVEPTSTNGIANITALMEVSPRR